MKKILLIPVLAICFVVLIGLVVRLDYIFAREDPVSRIDYHDVVDDALNGYTVFLGKVVSVKKCKIILLITEVYLSAYDLKEKVFFIQINNPKKCYFFKKNKRYLFIRSDFWNGMDEMLNDYKVNV